MLASNRAIENIAFHWGKYMTGSGESHMPQVPAAFSVKQCYSVALASFARWWIPICLIAGTLMVVELVPKQLARMERSALHQTMESAVDAFKQGDIDGMEMMSIELSELLMAYSEKVLLFSFYAAPFVALIAIFLICTSLMAVKNRRRNYSMGRVLGAALVHMVLAFAKVLLIFLLLPLGMFVYVRLSFVTLLMLEEDLDPIDAIKQSWAMTRGFFWPLFGIVLINGTLQFALMPTVVGLIPATGFANTARSAAFTLLRQNSTTS